MKYKNVYAFLLCASALVASSSISAMEDDVEDSDQFKISKKTRDDYADADYMARLLAHFSLQQRRELLQQGGWLPYQELPQMAAKTLAIQTSAAAGQTLGKRTVDALYDYFDSTAQATKRIARAQAEQQEMVSVASIMQLKNQPYTNEEFLALVLLKHSHFKAAYEHYNYSSVEKLVENKIKKSHPDFEEKTQEEQDAIKEKLIKQIEADKEVINSTIEQLIKQEQQAEALNKVRNKMKINKRVQELTDAVTQSK